MNNAGLDHRLRKDGGNRVGKPFEAVDDGDQDVLDATVFQLVHDAQPEFGTLILLEPEAEDFLGAVSAYAQRDMHRLVADQPFIPDLDPQRVKENQRIDLFERAGLPGCDLLKHRIGDGADQIRRNGCGKKTVITDSGQIELEVPRDRQARFDPQLIAKYQRRFPGFDDKIISMYARGMSTREIVGHLRDLYGIEVSPDLLGSSPAR